MRPHDRPLRIACLESSHRYRPVQQLQKQNKAKVTKEQTRYGSEISSSNQSLRPMKANPLTTIPINKKRIPETRPPVEEGPGASAAVVSIMIV